jgi:hypothetical protein
MGEVRSLGVALAGRYKWEEAARASHALLDVSNMT